MPERHENVWGLGFGFQDSGFGGVGVGFGFRGFSGSGFEVYGS